VKYNFCDLVLPFRRYRHTWLVPISCRHPDFLLRFQTLKTQEKSVIIFYHFENVNYIDSTFIRNLNWLVIGILIIINIALVLCGERPALSLISHPCHFVFRKMHYSAQTMKRKMFIKHILISVCATTCTTLYVLCAECLPLSLLF